MTHRSAILPEAARAWLDEVARSPDAGSFQPSGTIGRTSRSDPAPAIDGVRRLAGATTSDVFAVDTTGPDGRRSRLVLRWYPDGGVLDDEPDLIEREAAALAALAATRIPAPRLIAAGPRALLMTHVHGGVRLALPDPAALRDLLAEVHALDVAPVARWRYAGYHEDLELRRPTWWGDGDAWERALRQTESARPSSPGAFIHRDLHPGNVLWNGRRIAGIVDWVNACAGPAEVDLAHCRVNLAVLWDLDAADAFAVIDPAWDIEAAFGFLDLEPAELEAWPGSLPRSFVEGGGPDLSPAVIHQRFEAFVREALARLG